MRKLTVIVLFFILVRSAYSQFDSSYVHITKNRFSVYPLTEFYTSHYHLNINKSLNDLETTDASYYTQNNIYLGVGASFYRIGLALSFKLPYSNIPELKNSRAFSFAGGYSLKKFYGELKLKDYRGLQQENIIYENDTSKVNLILREGIEVKQVSAMCYYMSSGKYNFDANFKNYNYQKKSAISFVVAGGVNYYSFFGSLDLSGNKSTEKIGVQKNVEIYSVRLMPGLATSIVYNKFYLSIFSLAGASYNYNILDKRDVRHMVSPYLELRSALGYNNRNFFCSLSFNYDYDLVLLKENRLGINNYMLNFKIGIKLNNKYLGGLAPYL